MKEYEDNTVEGLDILTDALNLIEKISGILKETQSRLPQSIKEAQELIVSTGAVIDQAYVRFQNLDPDDRQKIATKFTSFKLLKSFMGPNNMESVVPNILLEGDLTRLNPNDISDLLAANIDFIV